jgi:hypothetical protein
VDRPAEHGTVKRYGQGCECEPCAEAARPWRERWDALEPVVVAPWLTPEERRRRRNPGELRRQRKRREEAKAGLVEIPHGSPFARRTFGCNCEPCRVAANDYMRAYRARRRTG